MKGWVGLGLVVLAASPVMAQQKCVPGEAARRAADARKIQGELLKEKVVFDTDMLSPELKGGVGRFKAALTAVVDASLSCLEPTASPAAIQATLAGLLRANKPEPPQRVETQADVDAMFDPEDNIYGTSLTVVVAAPSNAPSLRSVIVSFGVECGNDTMLLLYAPKGEYWNDVLRWQSGDFDSISHAFGDFFVYAILPEATADRFRVVVAHGHPWCTSRFSAFNIHLLAPSSRPDAPRVVWHTERDYSRGDAVPRIRSTPEGFELRLNVPAINFDEYERSVVYRYRVVDDRVARVEPIALNGRGFVDEWLHMPWEEALGQIAPGSESALKATYAQFNQRNTTVDGPYDEASHGPVLACADGTKRFQVEMKMTRETFVPGKPGGRTEALPSTYFLIEETGNGYWMLSASGAPDPRCGGPDLMAK